MADNNNMGNSGSDENMRGRGQGGDSSSNDGGSSFTNE